MNRRGFLRGLLCAAPAIVAAPSLMRVSTLPAELLAYRAIPVSDMLYVARYEWQQVAIYVHSRAVEIIHG